MKTIYAKLTAIVTTLITLALVITLSANLARKAERYQTAAITQKQPGPEIITTSIDAMIDNLCATSGR